MTHHQLRFSFLPGTFSVCRLGPDSPVPEWARHGEFHSETRTPDELSIVCHEEHVPGDVKAERGWICFKLEGPIPFALTGVLASFVTPLSARGVAVFAISTFDTDYVLVKSESKEKATAALVEAGHQLIQG